jgi:pimeloyl-ACP methyl ester carboxylesterase
LTKKLYIFSGLGADETVFQLLDFPGYSVTFIKWINPKKDETIEAYASRISEQIITTKPLLIGLSFGGMVALEVAKQIETEKIILISSAQSREEIPWYYRIAGKLKLHKLLPTSLLKSSNFITNWFFGAFSTFDKQVLKQVLKNTDSVYLKWAIEKIVSWTNQRKLDNVLHIHGDKDKILPINSVKCDFVIKDGGHLMTLNKAEELSKIIRGNL